MSHSLGSLASDLTHVLRYQLGNQAVMKGAELAGQGRFEEAAGLYAVAAHVAEVLAAASAGEEPERAAHWRRVCKTRRRLEAKARAGAAVGVVVPKPRAAAVSAAGCGATVTTR